MRWALCSLAFVAACASASLGGEKVIDASAGDDDDASRPIDAPQHIDAAMPVSQTLVETTNNTVKAGNTVNCNDTAGGGSGTAENHYYRVFPLSNYSITSAFSVTQVDFAVQLATGTQMVTVKVGTYSDPVTVATTKLTGTITQIQQVMVPVPAGSTTISAPITADIPAGSNVIIELASPDGTATNPEVEFFPGSNNSGETEPSFIATPDANCAISGIVSYSSLGFPTTQLIVTVTGTHT